MNDDIAMRRAKDPTTSSQDLEELAKHENRWVRAYVAENPNVNVDTLSKLAKDDDCVVIKAVISQPATPTSALEFIVKNLQGTADIYTILNRPAIDESLQLLLASHESEDVRVALAEHKSTSTDVLKLLMGCNSSRINSRVAENQNANEDMLRRLLRLNAYHVSLNPSLPPQMMREMLSDVNNRRVFSVPIVKNPNCPDDLLAQMADVNNWLPHQDYSSTERIDLLWVMAGKSRINDSTFKILRKGDIQVRERLVNNPTIHPKYLALMALKDASKAVKSTAIQAIDSSEHIVDLIRHGEFSLSDVCIEDRKQRMTFGDFMLKINMVERYQELQSYELEAVINNKIAAPLATAMPNAGWEPSMAGKMHM
ncbi:MULTISPECIES: hypothetical protein [Aeromonas]|uniref:hypothetical protein n=1 Tax=Aeromonas TaxID=642 RepID=UPI002B0625E1|nr:hypothetical protein [Aeromonas jandaei]